MKKIVLGFILSSTFVLGSLVTYAEEVNVMKEEKEISFLAKDDSKELMILSKEKINLGGTGKIRLEKQDGTELKVEFEPFKNDGIELKKDGTYTGLKSGEFTFRPCYKVKEDKQKNESKEKEMLPEITIKVSDKKQTMLKVTGDYEADTNGLKAGESEKISRKPYAGIEMTGEFKPVKTDNFKLEKDGSLETFKETEETLKFEHILSSETEKELKEAYIKKTPEKELTTEDITIVDEGKQGNLPIEGKSKEITSNKKEIEVVKEYNLDKSTLLVGETANISIKPVDGISLTGEYKTVKNENLTIDKTGVVTAVKPGQVSVTPELMLSEESKTALKENYIKTPGNEGLDIGNIEIVEKNKDIPISVQIAEKEVIPTKKLEIDVTPSFTLNKQNLIVGETDGKITVNPINGITVKGKFKEFSNPVINFKADGTFIGLQEGKVELVPIFEMAQESLDEIADVFLKKPENTHFTKNDIEFISKEAQQTIPITFTAALGVNNNNNVGATNTNGGKTEKDYVPVQEARTLPQTNEASGLVLSFIGSLTILGSVLLQRVKR